MKKDTETETNLAMMTHS